MSDDLPSFEVLTRFLREYAESPEGRAHFVLELEARFLGLDPWDGSAWSLEGRIEHAKIIRNVNVDGQINDYLRQIDPEGRYPRRP